MKILGISGSPRKGQTTESLVKAVLSTVECETEFVSLARLNIKPCIACLKCADDNVCVLNDDMKWLRKKIVEADGYIIGAPNYFGMLNSLTHCFLERFFQFRHREVMVLSGKPVVLAGVGGRDGSSALKSMKSFVLSSQLKIVDKVSAVGPFGCHYCGYGETCRVGGYYHEYGKNNPITEDTTPCLNKQDTNLENALNAGRKLNKYLNIS